MRLQLSQASLDAYASKCGPVSDDFEADVSKIFAAFLEGGHHTFTRKDVTHVLIGMGQTKGLRDNKSLCWETSDLWKRLGKAIGSVATQEPGRKGYWKFDQPAEPAPVKQPTPPPPPLKDVRDTRTWVAIELSPMGEYAAARGELELHLMDLFGHDTEVFVPYVFFFQDGRRELFNVMEGYCFVESGLDDRSYLSKSYDSPYLKKVLHSNSRGSLALHTIPDAKVQELKDLLAEKVAVEIREGMVVEVSRGLFRGLQGSVISVTEQNACVLFVMRSLQTIRTIPRYLLMPTGGTDE